MAGNPDFDVFKLPDEHDELRGGAARSGEKEIAPYAAEVDEKPRFPDEALKALNAPGFHAMHIPEEYGGAGRRLGRDLHRDRGGRAGRARRRR